MNLRSNEWFDGSFDNTFQHRSSMRAMGHQPNAFVGKPMIGIANSWSDYNNCNITHKYLVEHVKRGVLMAGGYPMEFHTITTPADLMKPSDLIYRNLMAMDVEESIRSLPMDGVVLLCECDKTCPAQLMAAASCDIPAIQFAAGHRKSGVFKGSKVTYATDFWKFVDDYKTGAMTSGEWDQLEQCMSCSPGGCAVMGTASTMKILSEVCGMMLPGTSQIPAMDARRFAAAEETGRRIVEMVKEELRPSRMLTESTFHNAIKVMAAIGGSTNAVIHLNAIAGRLGIHLDLDLFQRLSSQVPLLVNLQPSGKYNMDDFDEAGGVPALMCELMPILDKDCISATGETIEKSFGSNATVVNRDVIGSLQNPIRDDSAIVVLKGNLAPDGAIIKRSACSAHLLNHTGRAVVFEDYNDMLARIDSEDLDVDESSVLVMRNCGPVGAGMPEWGSIPIPKKLLKAGVRDMVRISDARMSGTSFGAIVLHAAPESAIGGPLSLVRDGDLIALDVSRGTLELLVEDTVLQGRRQNLAPARPQHKRGYPRLFADHVLQAPEGCDLDFLRPQSRADAVFVPPVIGRG